MKLRNLLAEKLHRLADSLGPDTARRFSGWSFTFEPGVGHEFHSDGRGCPLWYLSQADYERAHDEARVKP